MKRSPYSSGQTTRQVAHEGRFQVSSPRFPLAHSLAFGTVHEYGRRSELLRDVVLDVLAHALCLMAQRADCDGAVLSRNLQGKLGSFYGISDPVNNNQILTLANIENSRHWVISLCLWPVGCDRIRGL